MDLSDNPELQAIFREEVGERAAALVERCSAMAERPLTAMEVEEARRHAHTIKGNALVMGYPHMGAAGKLVELSLKEIHAGERQQTRALGRSLLAVAELLEPAIDLESHGKPTALMAATATLEAFLGDGEPDPEPDRAVLPPDVDENSGDPANALPQPPDLGGLISSIENAASNDVTRVQTARLYQLINRAVEVHLDTRAVLDRLSQARVGRDDPDRDHWDQLLQKLDRGARELQASALDLAAVPMTEITATFPQLVRYLARRTGKEVRFTVIGDDIQVDRQIVDALREPLRHLIVNAVDHGVEAPARRLVANKAPTATLELRFTVEDNLLRITVTDDGGGIDWDHVLDMARRKQLVPIGVEPGRAELVRILYGASFSTAPQEGELSGDGFGLAAAAEMAELVNGGLHLESDLGAGTCVTLTVPNSIVLQDVLVVDAEGQRWGIPEAAVARVLPIDRADIRPGATGEVLHLDDMKIPVSSLARAVGVHSEEPITDLVVLATRLGAVGLGVAGVEGRRQVAVKGIGPLLGGSPHLTGAALLGGEEVVVVVEPNGLADWIRAVPQAFERRPEVLVVDDSQGARQLVAAALTSAGFDVTVASGAEEGFRCVRDGAFDAVVVDYRMPDGDGVSFVRRVRESDTALPIVMVSAVAEAGDQSRAYAAGVDAYLDKADFRQGVLASTLRSLLDVEALGEVAQ